MAYIANGAPGVTFTEQDTINSVVSSGVSAGAIVGAFQWGPCYEPMEITSLSDLVEVFGYPTDDNYKDWFCARNFLSYSSNLLACRCITNTYLNACNYASDATLIKSNTDFVNNYYKIKGEGKTASIYAKYPGSYGNKIQVFIVQYDSRKTDNFSSYFSGSNVMPETIKTAFNLSNMTDDDVFFCVMLDGEIVECKVYSLDKDATDVNGQNRYLFGSVNNNSNYVYLVKEKLLTYDDEGAQNLIVVNATLSGGADDTSSNSSSSNYGYEDGWNIFADTETYDIGIMIQGQAPISTLSNIVETRKDCIVCASFDSGTYLDLTVNNTDSSEGTSTTTTIIDKMKAAVNSLSIGNPSYYFFDGNYKYQYDSYNSTYRWVPLNGDIAGIFAQVDDEKACWFSPGGYGIKNCTKLAFNPTKANRDQMFKWRVNPVISKAQTGIVLWGDSTRASVNSSFNYVNVRRLFNYIEKNILSYAENNILWQQNNEDTQELFYNTVNPFLREIQGGRGIEDYRIVCDSTVNTVDVRTAGKFVAKIYIKPIFSIRWIEINFVTSKSDTVFTENSL